MSDYEQKFVRGQQRWGNLKVRIMQEINVLSDPSLSPQQRSQYANGVARLKWVLELMRKSPDALAESVGAHADPLEITAIEVPHQHDERYEIKSEARLRQLRTIAQLVGEETPDGMGFAVFMFDYGEGGSMWYMSSANRDDVAKSMREWLEKTERRRG